MAAPPTELWFLGIVIAAFLFIGLPAIRASVAIPDRIDWREVPETELTPPQRDFFAAYDGKSYGTV